MIDPADHDRLIRAARAGENPQAVEATPLYRRSVAPIRRLRDELSLTYLYTQVLGGGADIFYVLDGTEGADHSPIGSEDELTNETRIGLTRGQTSRAEEHTSELQSLKTISYEVSLMKKKKKNDEV